MNMIEKLFWMASSVSDDEGVSSYLRHRMFDGQYLMQGFGSKNIIY